MRRTMVGFWQVVMIMYDFDEINALLQSFTTHIRLKEISFCVSGTGEECLLSNTSNCVGKFIL